MKIKSQNPFIHFSLWVLASIQATGQWKRKQTANLDFPPALRYWVNKISNCNIVDNIYANACMFVLGIKSNPKYAFRGLHRELALKHFGALLDSTRAHWNITTQSVQTKDFIFSGANRRDHIPLCSQDTSAGSTVFICGWSKGIHCPWMEIFVVGSPARYTEHFKYLNRCFLEGSTATSVSKHSYSLPYEI